MSFNWRASYVYGTLSIGMAYSVKWYDSDLWLLIKLYILGISAKAIFFLFSLFGFTSLFAISMDYAGQSDPLHGLFGFFGLQSTLDSFTQIFCLPPFFLFFSYLKELACTGERSRSSQPREGVLRHLGLLMAHSLWHIHSPTRGSPQLSQIHRINGKLIGKGDAILQCPGNTLSQSFPVLSLIVPDIRDYWYPYWRSWIHMITGKHIGNGDAILQGMANTLSQSFLVLSPIFPDTQD